MDRSTWFLTRCAVVLIALTLPACGGSSKPTTTKSQITTATPTPSAPQTTTASSAGGGSSVVTSGGIHATLSAANHSPIANRAWPYAVTVMDASARPLSGTATIQFVFAGQVVGRDTPPTHPLRHGRWHDVLKFPARAVGIPLDFEVVVSTPAGKLTLHWPVRVKP